MAGGYDLKTPAALTCPTCGGAVADTTEDGVPYYTCHIGHRFAGADFDEAQFRQMEGALEVALRTLNERAAVCRPMAEAAQDRGLRRAAEQWESARDDVKERAEVLRQFFERGWRRPNPDENDPGE